MALTLSYTVRNLKVRDEVNNDGDTLPNAVVQTYWDVTGTDENGNTASWTGATPFSAATVPAGQFTAFEDLQEEHVLTWIRSVVDGDPTYKAHIIEQLQKQIDQATETEKAGDALPWAKPAEDSGE